MVESATREIMWNVSSPLNLVALYALLAVAIAIGGAGVLRHVELWLSGKPEAHPGVSLSARFLHLLRWGLLQRGVMRRQPAGAAHMVVFLGFLALLFATTMVFLQQDLGLPIYHGRFYLAVSLVSDVLGFGVLVGCGLFAHRRYVQKLDLLHNRAADAFLLGTLALLIVQGFFLEALRIHATNDPWRNFSPIGNLLSFVFWPISTNHAKIIHFGMWWFHTITVYAVIALAPYTKFFHILVSPANLFLKDLNRPRGALAFPGDLEQMMESEEDLSLGLGTIKDYTWKHLLDLDACTSCGRCQDSCPAYLAEKPLSPKWVILDTRNHALALHADGQLVASALPEPFPTIDAALTKQWLLPNHGVSALDEHSYESGGEFRSRNPLVQKSALKLGASPDQRIATEVIDSDAYWACTTCYACVEVCPVGINHVDQIIGNRRNMTLMHGEVPHEAQATLKALESRANPYGDPAQRVDWLKGLDVKVLVSGDAVDYLYWVGCVSAFDPRKQKIARALVKIMKAAGLSFGILGTAEGCTGDPARRLGEENLFQTLAKQNIELLKSVRFKTLVANCPHCFNTIKNEYPQLGNLSDGASPEIIHHSVLLRRLLESGSLSLDETLAEEAQITFHDPCYLGRYNNEYEAPRAVVQKTSRLPIVEMERSGAQGMCCGAGGGHFWMDLKIGKRINTIRTDQAAATGATKIATACPFCLQMMEDGVKLTDREGQLEVKDIAEYLADKLAN